MVRRQEGPHDERHTPHRPAQVGLDATMLDDGGVVRLQSREMAELMRFLFGLLICWA